MCTVDGEGPTLKPGEEEEEDGKEAEESDEKLRSPELQEPSFHPLPETQRQRQRPAAGAEVERGREGKKGKPPGSGQRPQRI